MISERRSHTKYAHMCKHTDNTSLAMGILTGIYKRRFDRADNANRKHPLLKPIPDKQLDYVASRIYFYIKHIIEFSKAEVKLPIKLSIELDNKVAPAGKEGAKRALAKELKDYLVDANGRGISAARIQEKFAAYKVDWNKTNIEAVQFLEDYTIKLSDYLSAQAEFELRSTIQDGLLQGEGAAGINRMIKDQVLDTYQGRSMSIARTEGMRALNGARMNAYEQMGFDEVFWIASDLACDECKDLDNKIFAIDEMPPQPFHPNCFAKGTEILTNNGFKDIKDIEYIDRIFSINTTTLKPEWVAVIQKIQYPYKGIMHRYENRWNAICVTPNHELFIGMRSDTKDRTKIRWISKQSQDIDWNDSIYMYKSTEYDASIPNDIVIGNVTLTPRQYAILMGLYLTDGSIVRTRPHDYRIAIAQKKHRKEMFDLLNELPFKIHMWKYGPTFYSKDIKEHLLQFGKSYDKFVPEYLKNADRRTIRTFLDAYLLGDGSIRTRTYILKHFTSTEKSYHTSSKKMASDIVEMLLKLGLSASMSYSDTKGRLIKFRNGIYPTNHPCYTVAEHTSRKAGNLKRINIDYDDMVYCIETERNNTVLIRYENKILWTKQCRCTTGAITSNTPRKGNKVDYDFETAPEGFEW